MRRTLVAAACCVAALTTGCTSPPAGKAPPGAPSPSAASGPGAPSPSAASGPDYAAWAAGRSAPVADPIYPDRGTAALDVLHYGLELTWSPETGTLAGTATLRIRPTADAARLSLDFKPYTLDTVTLDGTATTGTVSGEKLTVPATVVADRPVTLVVRYHGRPTTSPMPSHRGDAEALGLTVTRDGGLWTMQEPYGAFTWYPANDQPSDEALYDIAVTVPRGWSAVASGTPAGQDGTTFRYRSTDPVASYLTTLAVGKYKKETATGPHGLPLTYWYRPRTDDRLLPALRRSPKHIAWLEKRFGPYPFPTGGIVVVPSASAMETQQMVTLGGRLDAGYVDSVVLHEYAHHWFGNSVTPTNWKDLWLNEGWATYAQSLYEMERDGFSAEKLEADLRAGDADLREQLGPPGSPRPDSFAEGNVYICPAAMLHELHDALGDTEFFALARAWVQEQRNTQQDRASFVAFVNRHTGRDFTSLIDAWLDATSTPE